MSNKIKIRIKNKRASYFGAKRRNDSLERRMEKLTEAIQNRKIVLTDPTNQDIRSTKYFNPAQVADLKRRREEVKNDLLLSNHDCRAKEFEFKAIVKNKASIARGNRITIRKTFEKNKTNDIIKLLNTSSTEVREDLNSFKTAYPENLDTAQTQIKGNLLKIIRKVNTGMPITNISIKMTADLHSGISRWDGQNVKIMEKV